MPSSIKDNSIFKSRIPAPKQFKDDPFLYYDYKKDDTPDYLKSQQKFHDMKKKLAYELDP